MDDAMGHSIQKTSADSRPIERWSVHNVLILQQKKNWGTVPSGSRSRLKLGAADTLIHRNLVLHATTLPRSGLTMT